MRVLLDTNVILRCILGDDPVQSPKAARFIKSALADKQDIYIPDGIILELVWVLERRYKVPKPSIASELKIWIRRNEIDYDHRKRLLSSLSIYENSKFSITDAYLAAATQEIPEQRLATFDHALQKETHSAAIE